MSQKFYLQIPVETNKSHLSIEDQQAIADEVAKAITPLEGAIVRDITIATFEVQPFTEEVAEKTED